jgi:hypothetical protein
LFVGEAFGLQDRLLKWGKSICHGRAPVAIEGCSGAVSKSTWCRLIAA